MKKISTDHHFLPGLNGLRAIAALSVVIQHTGMFLGLFGYVHASRFNHLLLSGHAAVLLFFVLSGFLITYLLLQEQAATDTINLKKFYLGRFLRIAPLQLLIVGLSFLMFLGFYGVISFYHEPTHPLSTFLLLIFMPNVAGLFDGVVNGAGHLWSLGAENEFYLVWPLLLLGFRKWSVRMMLMVVIFKVTLDLLLAFVVADMTSNYWIGKLAQFLGVFPIEAMAIGGIGAWLIFNRKANILNVIFHPIFQLVTYLSLVGIIYSNSVGMPHYVDTYFVPLVFFSLILNVSCNPRSILKLENSLFDYLGKISYGIYMFHPIVVFLIIWYLRQEALKNSWFVVLVYALTVTITILLSELSFKYFESPIMRLKRSKTERSTPTIPSLVNEF